MACSAAGAFAASLLNLRVGGGADGNVPRTHQVVHEFRHEGLMCDLQFCFARLDGLLLSFLSEKKHNTTRPRQGTPQRSMVASSGRENEHALRLLARIYSTPFCVTTNGTVFFNQNQSMC